MIGSLTMNATVGERIISCFMNGARVFEGSPISEVLPAAAAATRTTVEAITKAREAVSGVCRNRSIHTIATPMGGKPSRR